MFYKKLQKDIILLYLLSIILFMISPLLILIPIIIGIGINKKVYIQIALLMSVLSYLFIPNKDYDLARHWTLFFNFKDISLNSFFNFLSYQKDYVLSVLLYVISLITKNPSIVNLVVTFITYYLFFLSFNKIKFQNNKLKIIMFLIYYLSIDFLGVVSGMRTMLAISIAIYAILQNNKYKLVLLLLIAGWTHIFTLILLPFVFLSKVLKKESSYKIIFLLSVVITLCILNNTMITKIIQSIPILNKYQDHILVYINGNESHYKNYGLNFNGILRFLLSQIIEFWLSLIIFIIVQSRISKESFLKKICFLLFSLCILLYKFPIMQARYLYLTNFICLFFYAENLNKLKSKRILLVSLFSLKIMGVFLIIYPYRHDFKESYKNILKYNIFYIDKNRINYLELYDENYSKEIKMKLGVK